MTLSHDPNLSLESSAATDANPSGPALPNGNEMMPTSIDPSEFERAFAAVEDEIRAVPANDLIHITIDVRLVAVNTVARLPRMMDLRDEIVKALPEFEIGALDGLKTYALAAAHAYFLNQMSIATPAEVADLAERAAARRAVLLADVKALVAHGLIDGAPLEGLAGAVGHRNIAYDVILLRNLLVDAWPKISGRTVLTTDALESDAAVASRLLMAAGQRSVSAPTPTEAALLRDQAFTLFSRKYDQVRRATAYVRWNEDDANEYAPSLYAGRRSRKREASANAVDPGDDGRPTTDTPVTAATAPQTSASSASAPSATASAGVTTPFVP